MKYVAQVMPAVVVMEYSEHTAWFPLFFGLIWGGREAGEANAEQYCF